MNDAARLVRLTGFLLVIGVISLLGFYQYGTGGRPPRDAVFRYSTAEGTILLYLVVALLVFLLALGTPKRDVFALRAPRSWTAALGAAFVVFLAVNALAFGLDPVLHAGREQGLTPNGWRSGREGQFAANVVAFGAVGPLVEELLFRGLGYTLLAPAGRWTAIGVLGIAFGLWHGIPEALPVLVVFGVGLAYLRSATRSLYPGLLLHVIFNVLALVVGVLS